MTRAPAGLAGLKFGPVSVTPTVNWRDCTTSLPGVLSHGSSVSRIHARSSASAQSLSASSA